MNCKNAEKFFLRAHDGLLSKEESKELENHITDCPLCQKNNEEFQNIFDILQKNGFSRTQTILLGASVSQIKRTKNI